MAQEDASGTSIAPEIVSYCDDMPGANALANSSNDPGVLRSQVELTNKFGGMSITPAVVCESGPKNVAS